MSDAQNLKDDIAYVRALSEEGQKAGNQGGLILAAAGFGWAGAALANWAVVEGHIGSWGMWGWWAPIPLFAAAMAWTIPRSIKRADGRSPGNFAMQVAWQSIGFAFFAVITSFMAAAYASRTAEYWAMMPPMIFALYGAAWMVFAIHAKNRWFTLLSVCSIASAPLLGLLVTNYSASMLAYATGLSLLVGLPGVIMLVRELSAKD